MTRTFRFLGAVCAICTAAFASLAVAAADSTTRPPDPERAYESVARVWKPDETWRRYMEAQLGRNGVRFQPY